MKRNEIIVHEHKKGVRAVKYNQKPQTTIEPPKPRNPVAKNAGAAIGGGAAGAHKDKKKAAKQGDVKHKTKAVDMAESGRFGRSSYYNPMDQERDQQRQMDYDKREFKRQELQHELGHEDDPDFERKMRQQQMDKDRGPWYLKVDGKVLKVKGDPKVFDWKRGANNYALAVLKNKPELQGKIFLTKKGEDDVAEGEGKVTASDPSKGVEITNPQTGVKTTIPPTMSSALAPDAKNPGRYTLNPQAVQPGGDSDQETGPKVGSQVSIPDQATEEDMMAAPGDSRSPIHGDEDHDEMSKLLVLRLRRLAGL